MIWFVSEWEVIGSGLREADEAADSAIHPGFLPLAASKGRVAQIRRAMASIVLGLRDLREHTPKEISDYARNRLCVANSEALWVCVYPIHHYHGKQWPQAYSDELGLSEIGFRLWIEKTTDRFRLIRGERRKRRLQLTICMQKQARESFVKCFGLPDTLGEDHGDFTYYRDAGILLTPSLVDFKTGRLATENIQQVIDIANSHRVNPFLYGSPNPDKTQRIVEAMFGDDD